MKRIILFSTLTTFNSEELLRQIFPPDMTDKRFAYMPSDGANAPSKYVQEWQEYAIKYEADFVTINNSSRNTKNEINKLVQSNILVISGGNTFTLLHNLRLSGLDQALKEFINKENFILGGFSAGAIVLTPTINICTLPDYDENAVGLDDLTGLGIVPFEIFPHYSEQYKLYLDRYENKTKQEVRKISDDDYLVINQ